MKSMTPNLRHAKRTANLRSTSLFALQHRFGHEVDNEAYLVAIMATRNERMGFNVFTVDLSAWDEAQTSPIRKYSENYLEKRREDPQTDIATALPELTNGDANAENTFLLGVALIDRLKSQDFALMERDSKKTRIEGYLTLMVFADQSAASVVTQSKDSHHVLMSNAPFDIPYMEASLYDVPSSPKDYSAFTKSEATPFLDLLHLFTVMTADQDDLQLL